MRLRLLLAATALALATPAAASPADDFARLLEEHYAWLLRQSPVYATSLGVRSYDDQLGDNSDAAREARVGRAVATLTGLNRIPADQLSPADRVTYGILKRDLEETIEGWRFGQRDMLFTTYSGWHQNFAGMADNLPFNTRADFESYLTRLGQYPRV